MSNELISRSEFSRRVGVSATAVTKACKGALAAACEGIRINPSHPAAIEYARVNDPLRPVNQPPVMPGIDALYQPAIEYANQLGRLTSTSIQNKFGIGYERARKIKNLIETAGAFTPNQDPTPVATVTFSQVQEAQRLLDGGKLKTAERAELEAAAAVLSIQQSLTAPTDDYVPLPTDDDLGVIEDLGDWTLRDLVKKFGTAPRFKDWLASYKSLIDINAKEIANEEKRGKLIPREFVQTHILSHYDRAHINLMTDAKQTITRRIHSDIKAGMSVEDCEIFVGDQISRHIKEAKASIERALNSL